MGQLPLRVPVQGKTPGGALSKIRHRGGGGAPHPGFYTEFVDWGMLVTPRGGVFVSPQWGYLVMWDVVVQMGGKHTPQWGGGGK